MNRITDLGDDQRGLAVTHAETGAPGRVIDICDGYRVRVQWDTNGRITRTSVDDLREKAFRRLPYRTCYSNPTPRGVT
jgi:hypothetical protein